MGINFPNAPAVGTLYPQPTVPGVPVYRWDGIAWSTQGAALDKTPVYTDGSTSMAAQLGLVTPPTANVHAASKKYVDDSIVAYAAPLDTLAYNGMQINGSFEVSQERAVGTAVSGSGYVCDGWQHVGAGTFALSSSINPIGSGFGNGWQTLITGAQVTLGATDYLFTMNLIEGYRMRRLAMGQSFAQPVTVAFWSAHHRTGLYSVSLRNGAGNRSCVMTYTQTVADQYQYNVLTFPGCPDGVWDATTGLGLQLVFCQAAGTTYTAPAAGNWYTGNYLAAPGQVNGVGSTADVFRLGEVVALPGLYAPTAARCHLISKPYDEELLLCRRYWWCSNPATPKGAGAGLLAGVTLIANAISGNTWRFTVPMRIQPQIQLWNNGVQNQVRNTTAGTLYAVGAPANTWIYQEGGCIISCTIISGVWVDFDLIADARF